ncbi:unnamed protein product [Mytilus edulis]|uniref:Transposable element P transposase-like RNase H C-terminal domain-containing protein n=1 Tax=Mytilus edulis TaxID=6550 RepID=A0A8S3ST18_MYTED|nr:unnamed protein product [Mytilus edulis]
MVYGDRTSATTEFIRHMDNFFDCLNVRNLNEGHQKRKDNLKPFTDPNDPRLDYLTDDFLKYFDDWKQSVEARPGEYSKTQKNQMQLSYQTLEGFRITVRSVVECTRLLLRKGMPFVLTERFNQDPIEQHFGIHRTSGGCNNNPTVNQFNHAMVKIRTVECRKSLENKLTELIEKKQANAGTGMDNTNKIDRPALAETIPGHTPNRKRKQATNVGIPSEANKKKKKDTRSKTVKKSKENEFSSVLGLEEVTDDDLKEMGIKALGKKKTVYGSS